MLIEVTNLLTGKSTFQCPAHIYSFNTINDVCKYLYDVEIGRDRNIQDNAKKFFKDGLSVIKITDITDNPEINQGVAHYPHISLIFGQILTGHKIQ